MTEEADINCSSAPLPVVQPGLSGLQEKVDESDTEENDADYDMDDKELVDDDDDDDEDDDDDNDDDDDDDGDKSVYEGESSIVFDSDDQAIILVE